MYIQSRSANSKNDFARSLFPFARLITLPKCIPPLLHAGLHSVCSDDKQMIINATVSHGMERAQDVPVTLDCLQQLGLWDDVENCCRYDRRVVIKVTEQVQETEGTSYFATKKKR